jgi:hypothetical protein
MVTMKRGMTAKARHLGIALSEELAEKLDTLIAHEKQRIGPFASVSATSFLLGLLVAEHERRFGKPRR